MAKKKPSWAKGFSKYLFKCIELCMSFFVVLSLWVLKINTLVKKEAVRCSLLLKAVLVGGS